MDTFGKVSIVMPCYNDGEYIEKSVESVLNSTYEDIELIVIDDGSTDVRTKDIISKFNEKEKIKVVYSNHEGPAAARNAAIRYAQGEYILPVDSDDLIDKSYIEKAVKILSSDENIGVVYCEAELFGKKSGKWDLPRYDKAKLLADNIVFITALFRKSDWEKIGGFRETLKNGIEDYDFWLSMLELKKDFYQIPEVLFYYRIKDVSRTTLFLSDVVKMKETYQDIYDAHKVLYRENADLVIPELRNVVIDCSYKIRMYTTVHQMLDKFPRIKKLIKKFLGSG